MPALIDLRRRIKSIRNSQQVTQAMKTVATARYKKAHRIVVERRPFWHTFPDLALSLTENFSLPIHPFLQFRPEKKIAVVVITSDKGLCGAFNSNLLNAVSEFLQQKKQQTDILVFPVGKKAVNYFRSHDFKVGGQYFDRVDKRIDEISQDLTRSLEHLYYFFRVDAVYVFYNEFRSIISPRLTMVRLLPLRSESPEARTAPPVEFDWEPEATRLVDYLLKFYLGYQVKHFLYESQAAEQASRMMAMENATRNAEELISDLILLLNKMRQASITKELLEIQTAVEALRQQGV